MAENGKVLKFYCMPRVPHVISKNVAWPIVMARQRRASTISLIYASFGLTEESKPRRKPKPIMAENEISVDLIVRKVATHFETVFSYSLLLDCFYGGTANRSDCWHNLCELIILALISGN